MVQIVLYTVSMNEWQHQHSNLVKESLFHFFKVSLNSKFSCRWLLFASPPCLHVTGCLGKQFVINTSTLFITGHTSSSPGQINDKQTTKRGHQRPEASQDYYWYWPPEVGPMSSVFLARNLDASVYFPH